MLTARICCATSGHPYLHWGKADGLDRLGQLNKGTWVCSVVSARKPRLLCCWFDTSDSHQPGISLMNITLTLKLCFGTSTQLQIVKDN